MLRQVRGSHLTDKSEVVADKDHAALELSDSVSESVYRLHVQVVGGLVQQQQVRGLPGQVGKHDTTPLPVTQLSDRTNLQHRCQNSLIKCYSRSNL